MPSQRRIERTHFKQEFALEHRTVHREADMSLGQKLVETPRRHPLCAVAAKEPKIAFAVLAKTEFAGLGKPFGEFRYGQPRLGKLRHGLCERLAAIRQDTFIGACQDDIVATRRAHTPIDCGDHALALFMFDQQQIGTVGGEGRNDFQAIIRGSVIDNDDLIGRSRLRRDCGQRYTKLTRMIVVRQNNRNCRQAGGHGSRVCLAIAATTTFRLIATRGATEIQPRKSNRPALIASLDCDMSQLSQENSFVLNL